MIQSQFGNSEGPKPVGFSRSYFYFVVQALYDAARKLFASPEIVEDEFAVSADGLGDLLHRFNA